MTISDQTSSTLQAAEVDVTPKGVAAEAPASPALTPSDGPAPGMLSNVVVEHEDSAPNSVIAAENPGEGGETGVLSVTNSEFITAIFGDLPQGTHAVVCSKPGDPTSGGWVAKSAEQHASDLPADHNNYFNCSSFKVSNDGSLHAKNESFAACHVIVLDDVGTKIPFDRFAGFEFSYQMKTSPENYQVGISLDEPITDPDLASKLWKALIKKGLCDEGAVGPNRWARLPNGINGKPQHRDASGQPFQSHLTEYHPQKIYDLQGLVDELDLDWPEKQVKATEKIHTPKVASSASILEDDIHTPKAKENPVVTEFKARGMYKTPLGSGKHDVTCPWSDDHTDGKDTGATYCEPDDRYPLGKFECQHSHSPQRKIRDVLNFLGIAKTTAKHKPTIRVIEGDMHRVVDAAEQELAKTGRYYEYGGLIVEVSTNSLTGATSILPLSSPALTKVLSQSVLWEKYDKRSQEWVQCDPPTRHTGILYDSQTFKHIPTLAGIARQPYFRESDGALVTQAGYDSVSKWFAVFDARKFNMPEPTLEAAREALALLEDLLTEFHFASPIDRAAALSAFFTAVVRASLPYAPAYHVRAPIFGSGKTFLCELIGAFAGPGENAKVSYPTTSEEATKVILSLLLTSPSVIEFDDMDTDWIPHGTIKRMLTADSITDRILGFSKTATVSTRCLFLGSGNNVGPVRDLLRRVLTIHVDPRCATPATLTYTGNPVEKVRQQRALYVSAVLTIIMAWRNENSPRAEVSNIVTYSGAWSDYCRYPLIWLGHPDPATSLVEQVKHDPDSEPLMNLMAEWYKVFGSSMTTVRKVVTTASWDHEELTEALCEFPILEKGAINRSKLGWILKKNADRIVGGYKFVQGTADGRVAWQVVKV